MHNTIRCFLNVIALINYLYSLLDNTLSVENERVPLVCSGDNRGVQSGHGEVKEFIFLHVRG